MQSTITVVAAAPQSLDLFSRVGQEVWTRRMAAIRRRHDAVLIRRRIAAIDWLIERLEERNLSGRRDFDSLLRRHLYRLEDQVGLPLPRKAVRARNTVRLHAALLDWQESLLDAVVPKRLQFADVHDADWSTEALRGW